MLDWPMSSPNMTRMFCFLPPDGAGCCCACATWIGLFVATDAAASVAPSTIAAVCLSARFFRFRSFRLLYWDIYRSLFTLRGQIDVTTRPQHATAWWNDVPRGTMDEV